MDWPDGELAFGYALVALAAGLAQVGGIDGGARIAGTEDGVHSVAGSAIGRGDFAFFDREPVIAVGVGCEAIDGQVIAQRQARIAVATAAGLRRDILGV